MNTDFSHSQNTTPPRTTLQIPKTKLLPVLENTKEVYKLWFNYRECFPKKSRYTLGDKIDKLFLDILDLINIATYQNTENKIPTLSKTILRLDALKFFLMISWEVKLLDNQKYILLSERIQELGKIVWGWKKGLETKNFSKKNREEKL